MVYKHIVLCGSENTKCSQDIHWICSKSSVIIKHSSIFRICSFLFSYMILHVLIQKRIPRSHFHNPNDTRQFFMCSRRQKSESPQKQKSTQKKCIIEKGPHREKPSQTKAHIDNSTNKQKPTQTIAYTRHLKRKQIKSSYV